MQVYKYRLRLVSRRLLLFVTAVGILIFFGLSSLLSSRRSRADEEHSVPRSHKIIDPTEKIDWHDEEFIRAESEIEGR